MSWQSHALQWVYIGTPLLSFLLFTLAVAILLVNIGVAQINWWGWLIVLVFCTGGLLNVFVFFKVFGIYAGRWVVG